MTAKRTRTNLMFHGLDGREVVGRFDGGEITSRASVGLLREVEHRRRILDHLRKCFTDHRDPDRIEHWVKPLVKRRVLDLCLRYEDLNAHPLTSSGAWTGRRFRSGRTILWSPPPAAPTNRPWERSRAT